MATRGRPPGQGKVPGSGRKRGGLDKSARLLITETMAADILKVYKRLGKDWLFEVAKTRPDLFINQCLSRLLPPAFKDGADVELYQQVNIGEMSDLEAGRRVAFALAKAAHDQGIDVTPETAEPSQDAYINPNLVWTPPDDVSDMPEPMDDPARRQWGESLSLSADEKLIKETRVETLKSYAGSPAEQGYDRAQRQSFERDPRAAARDRMLARRRRDLL